jgi:hypothetical protein
LHCPCGVGPAKSGFGNFGFELSENPVFQAVASKWLGEADKLKPIFSSKSALAMSHQLISYEVSARPYMAHSDLNDLLNALLPMAEMLLTKQGEFYPIGAIMLSCGEIRHVGAKIEGNDHPPSQSLIDLLTETFQKEATKGNLRAAGICYDVLTVPPGKHQKQDAICCGLEHYSGEVVDVFKPYARTEDGTFHFDDIFAAKRMSQFFCQLPRG